LREGLRLEEGCAGGKGGVMPVVSDDVTSIDDVKALGARLDLRVTDLIALSKDRDPFYIYGRREEWAQWFAKLWRRYGFRDGVHLRRIHYVLISQKKPVLAVGGKIYRNTERCWKDLSKGACDARYLGLVPTSAFVDRRNDEPVIRISTDTARQPEAVVGNERVDEIEIEAPSMPELPSLQYYSPRVPQRYHLELWCEKTTVNDILMPLAEAYQLNVVTGSGETSLTACDGLVDRALQSQKPVRVLYISDFDPGGMSMPLTAARKIEHRLRREGLALDIQVRPIVLTHAQAVQFALPRTPIKDGERRAAQFEGRYGEGATEFDALEALHPGELRKIIEREILRYYDPQLGSRITAITDKIARDLGKINRRVDDQFADEIAELEADWEEIAEEYRAKVETWVDRANEVSRGITERLEELKPDLSDVELPAPAEGDEDDDPLYDSTRDYEEQIDRYKQHQGR
jgi:hypothetical protein